MDSSFISIGLTFFPIRSLQHIAPANFYSCALLGHLIHASIGMFHSTHKSHLVRWDVVIARSSITFYESHWQHGCSATGQCIFYNRSWKMWIMFFDIGHQKCESCRFFDIGHQKCAKSCGSFDVYNINIWQHSTFNPQVAFHYKGYPCGEYSYGDVSAEDDVHKRRTTALQFQGNTEQILSQWPPPTVATTSAMTIHQSICLQTSLSVERWPSFEYNSCGSASFSLTDSTVIRSQHQK